MYLHMLYVDVRLYIQIFVMCVNMYMHVSPYLATSICIYVYLCNCKGGLARFRTAIAAFRVQISDRSTMGPGASSWREYLTPILPRYVIASAAA